jgi:hypothetical protein
MNFTRQSLKPLSARNFRAAVHRVRELADAIESRADATESHERAIRTRAINDLSHVARDLARRNRGLSVAEQIARDTHPHTADAYDAEQAQDA